MEDETTRPDVAFVLDDGADPDERLENALLWKALKKKLGGRIAARRGGETLDALAVFGRFDERRVRGADLLHPQAGRQDYWAWPTFLANAGREVATLDLEGANAEVGRLQARGQGAFLKSTRQKHMTMRIGRDEDFGEALGDMAYSFCDAGACLIVQPLVEMAFEYRAFVVGGRVVAGAGCVEDRTPADFQRSPDLGSGDAARFCDVVEARRGDGRARRRPDVVSKLVGFARAIAPRLVAEGAPRAMTLDVCMIDGEPRIVEVNPFALGRVGLFATPLDPLVDAVLADCGLAAGGPASPCVGICRLEDGICLGCGRTPEEISTWRDLGSAGRTEVALAAARRLAVART